MRNGRDYSPFQGKRIDFEYSSVMNTVTCATQKDNLIQVKQINLSKESGGKQPYQQNRVYDDNANTVTATQGFEQLVVVGNVYESGGQAGKIYDTNGISPTVSGQRVNSQGYLNTDKIRRLTEIECERLQGFPDNWTEYGNYDGTIKKVSKTQRYKMCGNAVSVPAVREIGLRLKKQMIL